MPFPGLFHDDPPMARLRNLRRSCSRHRRRSTARPHASPHQRSKSTRVPARGAALSTSPSLRRRKGSPPVSLIRTGCGQRADDPLYRLPISAAGEGRTRTNRGGDRSPPLRASLILFLLTLGASFHSSTCVFSLSQQRVLSSRTAAKRIATPALRRWFAMTTR